MKREKKKKEIWKANSSVAICKYVGVGFFFQTSIPDKEEPRAHWAGVLDEFNHLF